MQSSGEQEIEFGVPIPGRILPPDRWTRTALKRLPPRGPLEFAAIFGRRAPLVLDLGCGNGRSTILSALARPDHDHLGVDTLPVVIRYATRRANQRGLSNVRFAVKDAQTLLRDYMPDASAVEIDIYHPQPYHDARVGRHRLLSPRFLLELHRVLRPAGTLILQTDNPDYWHEIEGLVPVFFELDEQVGPWPDAPQGRTRREIVARQRGLKIHRATARRRDDIIAAEALARATRLAARAARTRGPRIELDRDKRPSG
jgi:tRNA (guanine-N7-)-methyltransferase